MEKGSNDKRGLKIGSRLASIRKSCGEKSSRNQKFDMYEISRQAKTDRARQGDN